MSVYIISDIIHYPKKEKESTSANKSDKMFTKRINQIIKTQINIPFFQILIYTYLSKVNKKKKKKTSPNATAKCLCLH